MVFSAVALWNDCVTGWANTALSVTGNIDEPEKGGKDGLWSHT